MLLNISGNITLVDHHECQASKARHSLSNKYSTPLRVNDKYIFLQKLCTWLDLWNNIKGYDGRLSRETFALKKSTSAITALTKYCIENLKINYVLPGNFQTDQHES